MRNNYRSQSIVTVCRLLFTATVIFLAMILPALTGCAEATDDNQFVTFHLEGAVISADGITISYPYSVDTVDFSGVVAAIGARYEVYTDADCTKTQRIYVYIKRWR